MSAAERHAFDRAIRQLDYAHQQLASALVINETVRQDLRDALEAEDASRARVWATRRRNGEGRQDAELAVVPQPRESEGTRA